MRNYHADPDGSEGNDIFVQMDVNTTTSTTTGKSWEKAFSNEVAEWTWDTLFHHAGDEPEYGHIQWDLAAGAHTLRISGRSREMAIDRIHLHAGHWLGRSSCAPLSQREGFPAPVDPEYCTDGVDGPAGTDGYVRVLGWDFFGSDIPRSSQQGSPSADACLGHCRATAGCIAFTWHTWGGCFPKHALGTRKKHPTATSAYLEAYRPYSVGNGCGPSPPRAPTDTNPTSVFTYEEDFGRGCCLSDGNENIHHPENTNFHTCATLCSAEPACTGIGLTAHEGCKLYTSPISHISENPLCQCAIRHSPGDEILQW